LAKAVYRLSIDLPTDLVAKLDAASRSRAQTRTRLVRQVLELWATNIPAPTPPPSVPPSVTNSWDVTL